MPALIIGTDDEVGVPNAMNAAWGGISGDTEITICLSESHKTTKLMAVFINPIITNTINCLDKNLSLKNGHSLFIFLHLKARLTIAFLFD